jgi:hypothetical protein
LPAVRGCRALPSVAADADSSAMASAIGPVGSSSRAGSIREGVSGLILADLFDAAIRPNIPYQKDFLYFSGCLADHLADRLADLTSLNSPHPIANGFSDSYSARTNDRVCTVFRVNRPGSAPQHASRESSQHTDGSREPSECALRASVLLTYPFRPFRRRPACRPAHDLRPSEPRQSSPRS